MRHLIQNVLIVLTLLCSIGNAAETVTCGELLDSLVLSKSGFPATDEKIFYQELDALLQSPSYSESSGQLEGILRTPSFSRSITLNSLQFQPDAKAFLKGTLEYVSSRPRLEASASTLSQITQYFSPAPQKAIDLGNDNDQTLVPSVSSDINDYYQFFSDDREVIQNFVAPFAEKLMSSERNKGIRRLAILPAAILFWPAAVAMGAYEGYKELGDNHLELKDWLISVTSASESPEMLKGDRGQAYCLFSKSVSEVVWLFYTHSGKIPLFFVYHQKAKASP